MSRLKRKIYLNDTSFIDLETGIFSSASVDGKYKNTKLNADELIALLFLCRNSNCVVKRNEIYKEVYGKSIDDSGTQNESGNFSTFLYKLRKKIINEADRKQIIKLIDKNSGEYMIPLNDSPFEDDEKEVEQLMTINKGLQAENEKLRNELREYQKTSTNSAANRNSFSITDFFEQAFSATEELGKVFSIDLALSSAWYLTYNKEYKKKIQEAIDRNIYFRIIVNISPITDIASLMQEAISVYGKKIDDPVVNEYFEDNFYYMRDEKTTSWKSWFQSLQKIKKDNPRLFEIRCAEIPIMHNICIVKGDIGNGWVRIQHPTYGNFVREKDPCLLFKNTDDEYSLYCDEFKYIWNLSGKKESLHWIDRDINANIDRYIKAIVDKDEPDISELIKTMIDSSDNKHE